jgi:hypothetical protein
VIAIIDLGQIPELIVGQFLHEGEETSMP